MIGIFLGEQNSGKTLSMTYILYRYYKTGFEIYSNYKLNFPHKKLTKELIKSYVLNQQQFNKSVFGIDEIYILFDSRNFGSNSNKIFSYFLLQSSKRNVHILGTAQYFDSIEKRFRMNVTFKVFCGRVIKGKDNIFKTEKSNLRFIDNANLYIKLVFLIKSVNENFIPITFSKILFLKANPIYKLYDTTELLAVN